MKLCDGKDEVVSVKFVDGWERYEDICSKIREILAQSMRNGGGWYF